VPRAPCPSLLPPATHRALTVLLSCAGKTSLLQVLAGKYMVGEDAVRILGRPAFHDIQLVRCCRHVGGGPQ
jgi:CCR4-NOT complex subunit CAF16